MEQYNYYGAVEHDVLDHIYENLESSDWQNNRDGLEEHLNDVLWTADNVTGNASGSYWCNASGSYWCNAWKAEEALCHNMSLLDDALDSYWMQPDLNDPEAMDVVIRCYVLPTAISRALDYLENGGWFDRPSVINPHGEIIPVNVAIQLMDDDLREELHRELAPCREHAFFDAYAEAHWEKFGEVWELAQPNPCY